MNRGALTAGVLFFAAGSVAFAQTAVPAAPAPDATPAATAPDTTAADPPVTIQPTADGALTLDAAIALALKQNELVGENLEAARRARARIQEVKAGALPQVRITGAYLKEKESVADLPFGPADSTGAATLVPVILTPGTSKTTNVALSQLLDVFGSVRRARKLASISEQVQQLNIVRSRSEVIYQTKTSYFNTLRAAGAVDVANAAVTDAQSQLKLAQSFVKAGVSARFDETQADVTLADRQQTLISARDDLALAGAALNNVLGRDVDTPVVLAALEQTTDRSVDIAGQTEKALQSRPEIVQADLGIRGYRETVGLQRIGNRPQFNLTANYGYNFTASGFSTNKGSYTYGASVSWPIFDGGATRARVSEAESDVRNSELQRQQLRRGVTLEVRQAGLHVQETADRFTVADKSVALAEESLRLSRARYQNGVSTQLEVINAETSLTQAQFNRNNALYDHMTARADFDAALMGRLSSASGASQSASAVSQSVTNASNSASTSVSQSASTTAPVNTGAPAGVTTGQ